MLTGFHRLAPAVCSAAFAAGVVAAPVAAADNCPPGHLRNAYTGQCHVQGSAPVINGVTCVASHLGLCSSFTQNQQPPRKPHTSIG
jgi:hypothetical protein